MRTLSDGQSEIFDVAAAIQAFVNDETRCQLELSDLTATQRKQAKSVVEKHYELSCESFGFGKERQLHIFKNSNKLTEHVGELHLTPIKERSCETVELERAPSSDRSTTASTSSPAADIRECLSEQSLSLLPHGFQVRNTFIDVEDAKADYREVQSMPHGMFGHYLRTEMDQRQPPKSNKLSENSVALNDLVLAPGTMVIIDGLQKLPAFNGSTGAVQSYDQESGRYSIALVTQASGQRCAKVKPEHVKVISPASHLPSMPLDDDLSGHRGAMDLQGFPSTPGWDDCCSHGYQMFRKNA